MDILIKGATTVTMNGKREIMEHADVAVRGNRIDYVGRSHPWDEGSFKKVIPAEDMILIPGLINSHYHSNENLLRGLFERQPLEIWRPYYRAALRVYDRRSLYISSMLGCIEMLKTGVTTALDHFFSPLRDAFMGAEAIFESFVDSGMRGVVAYTVGDRSFEDTIPIDQSTLDTAGREVIRRISADESATTDAAFTECKKFMDRFQGAYRGCTAIPGPSAPQRCSDELLRRLKALTLEQGTALHMHVLETQLQKAQAAKLYGGKTSIEHLRDIGFLNEHLGIAHGIWLTDQDVKILAAHGTSVVHNPASNLKLGSGLAPIRSMLDQQVNVAVATDGSASNDSLNMFEAMKLTGLIHTLTHRDYAKWISAHEVFPMATLHAAKVCGLQKEIGSIEEGKRADLVLLKKRAPSLCPLNQVVNQLVFSENGSSVTMVMVDGEVLVESGHLTRINEDKIYDEALSIREAMDARLKKEFDDTRCLEPALRGMYFSGRDDPS